MIVKKPWFRAKKYGYGWGLPLTWQGWIVMIAYFTYIIWEYLGIYQNHDSSETFRPFILRLTIASLLFLIISYFTGEKLKWRWGDKK